MNPYSKKPAPYKVTYHNCRIFCHNGKDFRLRMNLDEAKAKSQEMKIKKIQVIGVDGRGLCMFMNGVRK